MREHRFSTAAYRLLLRTYPREFRERFAADLEIDFLEMARTRGTAFAWRRVADRSLPLPAAHRLGRRGRAGANRAYRRTHRSSWRILHAIPALRSASRPSRAGESARLHPDHHSHPGVRNRREQRDLHARQRRAAASARLRRSRSADAGPRGDPAIGRRAVRRVARRLSRPRPVSAVLLGDRRVPDRAPWNCRAAASRNRSTRPRSPSSLFGVLGVAAAQGRTFLAEEDQQQSNVAIISHALCGRGASAAVAARVGARPRSHALHGRWRDAGRIRIPAPRRLIERDPRGRLASAGLHPVRKTGARA